MNQLQQFIHEKLKDIAEKLPTLVHTEPASFSCGFNTGYKQCLLDLDRLTESWKDPITGVMVQTYLKEYIAYERSELEKLEKLSHNIEDEMFMIDRFEDMVDECIDMLECIMAENKEIE